MPVITHGMMMKCLKFAGIIAVLFAGGVVRSAIAPTSPSQLKILARESFQQGDVAKGREFLAALLGLYREAGAANQSVRGRYQWSARLAEVAQEFLRAGELRRAMDVLGEAAELDVPLRDEYDNGLSAAAGGLHRQLIQLGPEARFELLYKWSMPTESRPTFRDLRSVVPASAPPAEFARALGERPRDTSFSIAAVGELEGLFSTAWSLVQAADETGRLTRLIRELGELNQQQVPGADQALTLARIIASEERDEELLGQLRQHLAVLEQQPERQKPDEDSFDPDDIWQFGYFDAKADPTEAEFKPLQVWHAGGWQQEREHPGPQFGWLRIDKEGGHPEVAFSPARRWIAPADGTLVVLGELHHGGPQGDGVRGRVVSSRTGLVGQWQMLHGKTSTVAGPLQIKAGDSIDFVTDKVGTAAHDHFEWTVRLQLRVAGDVLFFDSTSGFHGPTKRDPLADTVLAATCLQHDWLRPIAEGIIASLIKDTYGTGSPWIRPILRRAEATSIRTRSSDARGDLFDDPNLEHWITSSRYNSTQNARGVPRAVWLAHEDHVLHVCGERHDSLLLRYPLTGEFEFSVEAQDGGPIGTEGGVTYGGINYEAWGASQSLKVWDSDYRLLALRPCPFVHVEVGRPTFNRLSLKSTADGVTFFSNGHPIWTDTSNDGSSPWIGFRCFNDRRPIFRNAEITGEPLIPREVRLIDGDRLRGWLASYYNETMPPQLSEQDQPPSSVAPTAAENDWFARDGVLHGAHREDTAGSPRQSRLYYFRPLVDGESMSYEFEYKPNEIEVHPTLGRVAFLIEPDGVRLHWMTDGDLDWTGLAEDNAIVEPFHRRGPRELPLKAGDWNRMTLTLEDSKATLALNGTTIYQRAMERENDRRFGFYHDRHRTAVRVRNVVMRGDWPEQLNTRLRSDLFEPKADLARGEQHAINSIIDDRSIAENVFALRERVQLMPAEDRFNTLVDWVLPGKKHATFRLAGEFSSTHPVPFLQDDDPIDRVRVERAVQHGKTRVEVGGNLVSPVFDLIEVAIELGRLDVLRERVDKTTATSLVAQRSKVSLLVLLDIAREDFEQARSGFEQLLTFGDDKNLGEFEACWPEALAASRGILHQDTREIATELLRSIYFPQVGTWQKNGTEPWHDYLAALSGLRAYLELEDTSVEQFWTAPSFDNWTPVSFTNMRTRGEGRTRAAWHRRGSQVENLAGHEQDYLFYRIPLRGNYEVECDVTSFSWRESHLMVAGTVVAPAYLRQYKFGNFRMMANSGPIEPKLSKVEDWIRYRAVVRDGVSTTYFNGRKIHEQELGDNHDPWLAIRSWSRHQGAVRDLRISGNPIVPEQIDLAARPDLAGWTSYYGVTVGEANSEWRHTVDADGSGGMIGVRWTDLAGSGLQRLLRYHRPMIEDGTIDYEFFYQPGEVATHPALDRLAFILDPKGVRIHWITDGRYDRTGLSPLNVFDEPDNRRGPDALPLKMNDWNRMRFTLEGDTVNLVLNDQLVYQRQVERTNQRTFGLFHFGGDTEARVRKVVWRGDWPREVPAVAEQELAGEGADFLDQQVPELTSVFEHDFASDGLPEAYFPVYGTASQKCIEPSAEGVQVTRPGIGAWSQASFGPRFRARGDFDITATFDRLETKNVQTVHIMLLAILESDVSHHCRTTRGHHSNGHQTISGQLFTVTPDGGRRTAGSQQISESDSGRLRIARRGDMIYFLLAEGDSPVFRIIGQEKATTDDVRSNGIRLVVAAGEGAQANVVWKDISIRAEQLMFLPKELAQPVLFVMNADGTGVRQLTKPIGDLGSHGSPAWSPDGKQVAFDTYGGSTATSHIFTINADGTGLRDLGIGSMPTFSPDGRRIAFSWSGRGITVMNADGTNRQVLDPSGWGAQWSPDGKSIAYGSQNITILDMASKTQRTILEGEHAQRYGYIYWNMSWSPDSTRICFMGRTRDGNRHEIAVVNVAGSSRDFRILHVDDRQTNADFSWHPDGRQVLCSLPNPQLEGPRLYMLDVETPGPPQLFPDQPLDQSSTSADWSRDGQHIVFCSRPLPAWNAQNQKGE